MKYLTLFLLFLFVGKTYEIKILNKKAISDKITLEFKNKSSKPIFLFKGTIDTKFGVTNEKDAEVFPRNYSTWDPEYFRPEFSEDLISRTAIKYGIEKNLARKWLEIKNDFVIVKPRKSEKIIIDFDEDTYSYAYELNPNEKYYVNGEINFHTNFVPKKFIDSLEKKNIKFVENPSVKFKLLIDKETFFIKKEIHDEKWYFIK